MVNFVQDGDTLTVTAPYAAVSGSGVMVGTIFGVAADDIASGALGEIVTEGVFDMAKAAGVVAVGDQVYWDNTAKVVTTVAAGNKRVGISILSVLSGGATARVKLDEANVIRSFQSIEQTGTGSVQNVAHGLGTVPTIVIVYPTDLTPATTGAYVVTLGAHTSTNVALTVTASKKFIVVAFA